MQYYILQPGAYGNTWERDFSFEPAAAVMQPFCLRLKSVPPHTIGAFGQNMPSDGPDKSIDAMDQADTIVIGSSVYWHIICGSVRTPGG